VPGIPDRLGEIVKVLGLELPEPLRGTAAKLLAQRCERVV
jgi:hypothetical protein